MTLVVFARTKDFRFFRASQLVLMLLLPFLLQLSLGGYVASSAVSLWALVAVLRCPLLLQRATRPCPGSSPSSS